MLPLLLLLLRDVYDDGVGDCDDDGEDVIAAVTSPMNDPKHLQKQFSQATKSQELIQQRYKELWSW